MSGISKTLLSWLTQNCSSVASFEVNYTLKKQQCLTETSVLLFHFRTKPLTFTLWQRAHRILSSRSQGQVLNTCGSCFLMWKTNPLQKASLTACTGAWDRVSLDLSSLRGYRGCAQWEDTGWVSFQLSRAS